MQVKKEDTKKRIMKSASKEFIKYGYVEASLRVIAENENLTKGVVYSYFENKDALFCELVAPAICLIEDQFKEDKCCYTKGIIFDPEEASIQCFNNCADEVLKQNKSFRLLLFCSAGSSLQNYKEEIIQKYAQNFYKILPFFIKKEEKKEIISDMFIHTLAAMYVSFLEEIILHEPTRDEVNEYATQMAVFVRSGIDKLFSHQTQ
jgi:AcrR family transcriptional regulator